MESKKGLQVEWIEDAVELKVRHAAFNCVLNGLVTMEPQADDYDWEHRGVTYHFRRSAVAALDRKILPMTESGALVYLILLATHRGDTDETRMLVHPEFHPDAPHGIGAFNSATPDGRRAFGAAVSFLTSRYGRQPFNHGRVVGYIIGNEVNSHWFWYNRGEVNAESLIADYGLMLRVASEAVASQSTMARVYTSLDHYWAHRHTPGNPKTFVGITRVPGTPGGVLTNARRL